MIKFDDVAWTALKTTAINKKVFLSGNILRIIDAGGDPENLKYLESALEKDGEARQKRLSVNKAAQAEKKQLSDAHAENADLLSNLEQALAQAKKAQEQAEASKEQADEHRLAAEEARTLAEEAKATAEHDLDFMQKRTQFELMGNIVRVALYVITGVGITTTILYAVALFGPAPSTGDTTLLGNTWSNMLGILLTNSFSIIGTIMGVKYATENKGDSGA